MAKIDHETVIKAASLSRLFLSREEIDGFVSDLSSVLDYVEQLQKIDLDKDTKPLMQVGGLVNVMREDLVTNLPDGSHVLLNNAPCINGDFLLVKSIKE